MLPGLEALDLFPEALQRWYLLISSVDPPESRGRASVQ